MALQMFESDIEQFNPNNPYKGDERLPVEFYIGALRDDAASEREGRPIFKDTEFIRIYNSKDNILDRPVRDTDKQRWPKHYAAFKNTGQADPAAVGQRLEHWPAITRSQAEELRYFKIFTVEQLASAPDSILTQIPGINRLKQIAKVVMDIGREDAPYFKMQAQLEERDGKIAQLTSEVARLRDMIEGNKVTG